MIELALVAGFIWFVFNPLCAWLEKRSVRAAEFRKAEVERIKREMGIL